MKETYYKVDEKQFAKLAKNWYTQKTSWKVLNAISWIFVLIGTAAIIFMSIQAADPTVPSIDARVLLVAGGIILAVLPYCFAYVTKSQAIWRMGKPYTSMKQIFLYTNEFGFQFGYHDCHDKKWAQSMIVHQIAYENIHHVEVDQKLKLFTVVGRTERVEYYDMAANRIAYIFTNGQFGDMATFSFFVCFENEQGFFDELKAHNVEIKFV